MEGTKKRKREVGLPRITYDAATRTFDRLFKEDSLDAMKSVVRQKLGLSSSIAVHLSQLRDGQSVDLEDDEDFEAFSASAHSASTVKVKVILGENQTSSTPDESQTISSSKSERKNKRKSEGNSRDSSEATVTQGNSLENSRSSKKRQVSFAEAPEAQVDFTDTPKKKTKQAPHDHSTAGSLANRPEMTPASPGQTKPTETPSKARKRKKKNRNLTQAEQTETRDSPHTPGNTRANQASTSDKPKVTHFYPSQAPPTKEVSEDTPESEKSKKRSRTINDDEESPSLLESLSMTKIKDTLAGKREEPPLKKLKQKRAQTTDPPNVTANAAEESSGSQTSGLLATHQPSTVAALPANVTTVDASGGPTKQMKKSRKKKDVVALDVAENIALPVPKSVETTAPSEQPMNNPADLPNVKNTKKLTTSDDEETREGVAVKKVKSSQRKSNLDEPSGASAASPGKVDGSLSRSKAPIPDPIETSSDAQAPPTNLKKTKKVGKNHETGPPTELVAEEDDASGMADAKKSVNSTGAKNSVKGSKRKKGADADKSGVVAQEKSIENSDPQFVDPKEAARFTVLAMLSRKAEELKEAISKQASSVATNGTTTAQPAVSKDTIHEAHDDATSTKATQEKPQSPSTCVICDQSPHHVRSKCPVIKAGIKSMRNRIAELQAMTLEDDSNRRSEIIAELQGYIDKRTRKPTKSEGVKITSPTREAPSAAMELTKAINSISANPKSPFTIKPLSVRPGLSQMDTQPPSSVQISVTNTAATSSQSPLDALRRPQKISDGPLRPDFMGLGDVSLYTDQDLEALIRGPKVSLKDVPSSDTEDESELEQDVILEEDDGLGLVAPRNISRAGYASSSDDDEEEEEEKSPAVSASPIFHIDNLNTTGLEERALSFSPEDVHTGNISFQEVDAQGSSPELDTTGDAAVNDAVTADLAPLIPSTPVQEAQRKNEKELDSDTVIETPTEESPSLKKAESVVQLHPTSPLRAEPVEEQVSDPIEASEAVPSSRPEPIASDDDEPAQVESTPKAEVMARTRSQRNKALQNSAQQTQSQDSVDAVRKPARRTRSLTKLSELPIPLHPEARIIRRAPSGADLETPARPKRSTAATRAASAKPLTQPTDKAGRLSKATKTPSKPPKNSQRPLTQPKLTPVQGQEKTASNSKVRAKLTVLVATPEPDQPNAEENTLVPETQGSIGTWAILQESSHSRNDAETPGMVDELLSSPNVQPAVSSLDRTTGQLEGVVDGSFPDPLFIPAESQQSFPYSQYPDILREKQAVASPNESEDEDEVEKTITSPIAIKQLTNFRGLREIASQPSLYTSRHHQLAKTAKEPVQDLYGQNGQGTDESDDDSDSEDEQPTPSHIPAHRKAGRVAATKKR